MRLVSSPLSVRRADCLERATVASLPCAHAHALSHTNAAALHRSARAPLAHAPQPLSVCARTFASLSRSSVRFSTLSHPRSTSGRVGRLQARLAPLAVRSAHSGPSCCARQGGTGGAGRFADGGVSVRIEEATRQQAHGWKGARRGARRRADRRRCPEGERESGSSLPDARSTIVARRGGDYFRRSGKGARA